ncbi:MAG: hypothetical protein ABIQ51_20655 [Mesorhizobium sp.]
MVRLIAFATLSGALLVVDGGNCLETQRLKAWSAHISRVDFSDSLNAAMIAALLNNNKPKDAALGSKSHRSLFNPLIANGYFNVSEGGERRSGATCRKGLCRRE